METNNFGMQLQLPMLTRIDGPAMVRPDVLAKLATYREVVRWAWLNRKRRNMTLRLLVEEAGSYPSHISDYVKSDDLPSRKCLPAEKIAAFDGAVGNTAVSQWLAMRSNLPVLVLQERLAA